MSSKTIVRLVTCLSLSHDIDTQTDNYPKHTLWPPPHSQRPPPPSPPIGFLTEFCSERVSRNKVKTIPLLRGIKCSFREQSFSRNKTEWNGRKLAEKIIQCAQFLQIYKWLPPIPTSNSKINLECNLSRKGNKLEEKHVFQLSSYLASTPLHPPPPIQHLPYPLSLSSLCGVGTSCLCGLI